ncbi:MAG: nicotinate (nicotinamide) nucleotide adenylyltransferase [Bacteroidetes bacterium]|nr:nicotinate (nicotinamide) nucleotide adenylyltransferase [Bacteroidota bacterium]MDA1119166.1 nicotinate (nicotinamide) nucleotide adenylyltransferase [Bacteroidota bacterium]
MKVGLFFGSFNPIHVGHLIIANVMHESTDCTEIWFVVSPQNPFKPLNSLAHEFDRYDMAMAATSEDCFLKVSDVEFRMPRPSYTIDTLVLLAEKNPDIEFQLIMGSDNLHTFHKWKNHEQILENYGLLVYPRPKAKSDRFLDHPNVRLIEAPLLDISATFIRRYIKTGKSLKYLLPEGVINVIKAKKLYDI